MDKELLNSPDYDVLTSRLFEDVAGKVTDYDNMTADRVYLASNEWLDKYFKLFDLEGKKVATVGSSGDQMLYALLGGAKFVTVIDANPYSRAFIEYKMGLIASVGFEEFVKLINSHEIFSVKTYSKISHCLSKKVRQFWDTLMLEQEEINDIYDVFDVKKLARNLTHDNTEVKLGGFYKDEEEYYKLQEIIRKGDFDAEFITADLFSFPKKLKDKYDYILLSNIYDYNRMDEQGEMFNQTVEKLYEKKLNPGGLIQVAYSHRDFWYGTDPMTMAGRDLKIVELKDGKNSHIVYFLEKPKTQELDNQKD